LLVKMRTCVNAFPLVWLVMGLWVVVLSQNPWILSGYVFHCQKNFTSSIAKKFCVFHHQKTLQQWKNFVSSMTKKLFDCEETLCPPSPNFFTTTWLWTLAQTCRYELQILMLVDKQMQIVKENCKWLVHK
jgi:hypothetical protein